MSNPFDMNNLAGLLGNVQQTLSQVKEMAATIQATAETGGGAVKVTASAEPAIVSLEIDPAALDDKEMLEDMIRAAANEALRKAREEMQQGVASKMPFPIPPGLLG